MARASGSIGRRRMALAWLALVSAPFAHAGASFDVLAAWQAAGDLPALSTLADQMLDDPSSPYSGLLTQPAFTNEIAWADVIAALPPGMTEAEALAGLALELGLTRARPGVDVGPDASFSDPFVAADAAKAAIDTDIFWHMLDLGGYRHSARGASYAVALHELRRQAAAVPRERHASLHIDTSVLQRVMAARKWSEVSHHDLDYLRTLAQHTLIHRTHGSPGPTGKPLPPIAYRIARLAAAWRDLEGYMIAPPCFPDGSARNPLDLDTLCFVAATDRAVHRWYIGELRRQASLASFDSTHGGDSSLLRTIALLLPLLDIVAIAEVIEATVVDEMVYDGTLGAEASEAAEERAASLTCGRFP
jgi:hypothetical protein